MYIGDPLSFVLLICYKYFIQKSNTHHHENVLCSAISCEVNYAHHSRPDGVKSIDKTYEKYC